MLNEMSEIGYYANPGASDPLAFMAPTVSWEEISPAHAELLRVYEKLRPLKIAGHL